MKVKLPTVEAWNLVTLTGAAALGGGVWAQWGASWSFMLLGVGLLVVAGVNAWRSGVRDR